MTQLELAEKYINSTNVSVFLTGRAGTGKTTFLHQVVRTVSKRFVVLAPTGVAAVNASGVTIHSFFQLPLCPYLPDVKELVTEYQMPDKFKSLHKEKMKIIRTLELLIIDEISMVRADLLDAVDMTLRRYRRSAKPFGGVQLLMIGDVQQLPPVVTDVERPYMEKVYPSPFFFHSKALQKTNYITIELTRVFRQQDENFIQLLNNIRDNKLDKATLQALNDRFIPGFNPPDGEGYIRLTTHNYQSNNVNQKKLSELTTKEFELDASTEGNFPEASFPTEKRLILKRGTQVMFVKNDSHGQDYYNGKIGRVEDYDPEVGVAVVDGDGNRIFVKQERWENVRYQVDENDNQIKQVVDGVFVQYPLRLAWAITIHKSQGLTFDRVIVDAAQSFTFGQVYVALSRCRTLEGLVLVSPITEHCVFDNDDVMHFCEKVPDPDHVQKDLQAYQSGYYYELLYELFDFSAILRAGERLNRIFHLHLRNMFPDQTNKMKELYERQLVDIVTVSEKFRKQITQIGVQTNGEVGNPHLLERVKKGSAYFGEQLKHVLLTAAPLLELQLKNKAVAAELKEWSDEFYSAVGLKQRCLKRIEDKGFSTENYCQAKTDYFLDKEKGDKNRAKNTPKKTPKQKKIPTWVETARLFHEGSSINEIAKARGLSISTIGTHLEKAVESGALPVEEVLTPDELDDILDFIVAERPQSAGEIYQHFDGKYPYHKIRTAMYASRDIV